LLAARRPAPACAAPAAAPPSAAISDSARLRGHLYWPTDAYWKSRAPDTALVDIETSRGTITVALRRAWAPNGVDRAYNLARAGYFDDSRFYRVVDGFVAQFGLAGDPAIAGVWAREPLPADPRRTSNVRGTVTFAQFKPDDRTTNLFINLRDNPRLDALGFAPIGRVVKGMAIADRLYAGYGERPMAAANTKRVYAEANKFLDAKYPKLDRIRKVRVRTP
ncbi:peptidylprolyl isomerase, partial [Roseisolibacter sp. H3M3-2]|uniref:peptidylprolyl isomerase n=1 Tax=Roseisolibacter sp. H3M3-2 TaxID=3031323 RepID=UPI0023D9EFF3